MTARDLSSLGVASLRHDGPLVIGGGLAGLSAALSAAPRPVLVATPVALMQASSSAWAQGGVAAALGHDDSPAAHARDTEAAGAGLSDGAAVRLLTQGGPDAVAWLAELGAPFDRTADGGFAVSREAAHSTARVARVGGDGAGRAIVSALARAARRAGHLTLWEDARLVALLRDARGRVIGARLQRAAGPVDVLAPAVVLATGGVGGLYAVTTNPGTLIGEGLALAALAGAQIQDPEFVQFHPTAIDVGQDPAPLATEALRGEGARLIDARGHYLLGPAADADLAARDVVARAVHAAHEAGRGAFLDARVAVGAHFAQAFPAVFNACMAAGMDPRVQPIPVAPAAHYHMGGIAADADGRTAVPGLYAVGECAATGVHGANRLASNSLLEAVVFGRRAGRSAAAEDKQGGASLPVRTAPELAGNAMARLRAAMSRHAGVVRDGDGLAALLALIDALEAEHGAALPLIAARLIAEAALARRESRGGHFRSDYPQTDDAAVHTRLCFPPRSLTMVAE